MSSTPPPKNNYVAEEFNKEKFFSQLCKINEKLDPSTLDKNEKFKKFFKTLKNKFKVKTFLTEVRYVDRDYLCDYCEYYSRCFSDYPRFCSRIHFFTNAFKEKDFSALLKKEPNYLTEENFKKSYVGFMIVRPLPRTIIGRTCLDVKEFHNQNNCYYPVTREYAPHLFGIDLKIEKALAFQEQDKTVAACSTSALWSAFHKTGKMFQHNIPTPVEITRVANESFPLAFRSLPTNGLTPEQMAGCIRKVGLEPYLWDVGVPTSSKNMINLKYIIYAYVSAGIPALLLFDQMEKKKDEETFICKGKHAVTVVGYRLSNRKNNKKFRADRIDKIFVHDDQRAPYSEMKIDEKTIKYIKQKRDKEGGIDDIHVNILTISSSSTDKHRAYPLHILIPLYHKIRIAHEPVIESVAAFSHLLEDKELQEQKNNPFKGEVEWDIRISMIQDFQRNIHNSEKLSPEIIETILCDEYPRFLWIAGLRINNDLKMDLIFDATDIDQGCFLHRIIPYDYNMVAFLNSVFLDPGFPDNLRSTEWRKRSTWQIIKIFKDEKKIYLPEL